MSFIQPMFHLKLRATKEDNPQPDGEYGTSLRMFNRSAGCYDVVYTCERCMKRLCFRKEGDRLVGKVLDEGNTYWVFSDLTGSSFRWENMTVSKDGSKELICEIIGRRRNDDQAD